MSHKVYFYIFVYLCLVHIHILVQHLTLRFEDQQLTRGNQKVHIHLITQTDDLNSCKWNILQLPLCDSHSLWGCDFCPMLEKVWPSTAAEVGWWSLTVGAFTQHACSLHGPPGVSAAQQKHYMQLLNMLTAHIVPHFVYQSWGQCVFSDYLAVHPLRQCWSYTYTSLYLFTMFNS